MLPPSPFALRRAPRCVVSVFTGRPLALCATCSNYCGMSCYASWGRRSRTALRSTAPTFEKVGVPVLEVVEVVPVVVVGVPGSGDGGLLVLLSCAYEILLFSFSYHLYLLTCMRGRRLRALPHWHSSLTWRAQCMLDFNR